MRVALLLKTDFQLFRKGICPTLSLKGGTSDEKRRQKRGKKRVHEVRFLPIKLQLVGGGRTFKAWGHEGPVVSASKKRTELENNYWVVKRDLKEERRKKTHQSCTSYKRGTRSSNKKGPAEVE